LEILAVLAEEGFNGCVVFVDGTTFPLYQQPASNCKVYWDKKKQYSINCQVICNYNKYITAFLTGWPGSCGNSMVFQKMRFSQEANKFFDSGEGFLFDDTCFSLYTADSCSLDFRTILFGQLSICIVNELHSSP
jgi:hypothetical protein